MKQVPLEPKGTIPLAKAIALWEMRSEIIAVGVLAVDATPRYIVNNKARDVVLRLLDVVYGPEAEGER